MIKSLLITVMIVFGAVKGQAAECLDAQNRAMNIECLDMAPLGVYPLNVSKLMFGGSFVSGAASWEKIPSVIPEDMTYEFKGTIGQTTQGLYLNEADMSKYLVPYRYQKEPVVQMPINREIKLESLAPVYKCEKGNFLLVFNEVNQVICSELSCNDQGETEQKIKCGTNF